jgi:type IV secretory pathway component VirB8
METNMLEARMAALEAKVDATYRSVEKMRKYMLIVAWVTVGMVVVPAILMVAVVPLFINSYVGALGGI